MMSPVSRSATTHASAEMSSGTGGVPGAVMIPHPDSASPPSGLAGTGSGAGGSPDSGTSEESTAGGVTTRYGQASSALAKAGLPRRQKAARRGVATNAAARRDT